MADLVNDAVAAGKRSPLGSVLDTSKDSFGGVEYDNDGLVSLLGPFFCVLFSSDFRFFPLLCKIVCVLGSGEQEGPSGDEYGIPPPRCHRC